MHINPLQELAAAFSLLSPALIKVHAHNSSPWVRRASKFPTAYKNAFPNDSIALHAAQGNPSSQGFYLALKTAKSYSEDNIVATENAQSASGASCRRRSSEALE